MIPSAWLALEQLPLTPNGKVDRKALPAPQIRGEDAGDYAAPRSELERVLADIWAKVLRVDQVGIQDNFFELGGHSLLGMKLVTQVGEQLSVTLPVSAVFKYPTIERMSKAIDSLRLVRSGAPDTQETEFESGVL